MISILSKFRRPETVKSQAFSGNPLKLLPAQSNYPIPAPVCNPMRQPAVRHTQTDRNSRADKSQGGSTRYPLICVAQGNCMDKGEPSNRRTFLQAKGGELYPWH